MGRGTKIVVVGAVAAAACMPASCGSNSGSGASASGGGSSSGAPDAGACSGGCAADEQCCEGACVVTSTCSFAITQVTPASAPQNGGDWLTLKGAGFAKGMRVWVVDTDGRGDGRAPDSVKE